MSEYVPFGDEWKKEVMRLKKSEIVDMLAKALRENASRPTPRALDLRPCGHSYLSTALNTITGETFCAECAGASQ